MLKITALRGGLVANIQEKRQVVYKGWCRNWSHSSEVYYISDKFVLKMNYCLHILLDLSNVVSDAY